MCLNCNNSFQWRRLDRKFNNQLVWFKEWLSEGYSIRQLSKISGIHPKKIRKIIHENLESIPALTVEVRDDHYFLCDGTFIEGRKQGLFVIMSASEYKIVAGRYGIKEKQSELVSYFTELKNQGMKPKSFTTDGNTSILNALRVVWPNVVIQRCLVHIQRQGLMWCRAKPKRLEAQKLRILFLQVTDIKDKLTAEKFLQDFSYWDKRYGQKLLQGKTTGWVVNDLIRARSMLLNSLPNMFHFLIDSNIPSTTNALEGYFSRLKGKYRQHRGLNTKRRFSYFNWYLGTVKH